MIRERLGVISDEVSDQLEEAIDWAKAHGITYLEIRTINGINVMKLTDKQLELINNMIKENGLLISAIASPIFKCSLNRNRHVIKGDTFNQEELDIEEHFNELERAFQIANKLETSNIRIFSFWREEYPELYISEIIDYLTRAAKRAEEENKILLLENEPTCNGGFASEVKDLVVKVNSKYLRALWDPGNEVYGGKEAYPKGYNQLKDWIGHIHLKDAVFTANGGKCVPIGQGEVPYMNQLTAIIESGYDGLFVLETHYIPPSGSKKSGTTMSYEGLEQIIGRIQK